jgi:excisionase family DNA binding protein
MNCPSSDVTSPDCSPETERQGVRPGRDDPERPLLLTVRQAAEMIGIGRSTLYRIMERGEIHSVHIGASRRIPLFAVHEFVECLVRQSSDRSEERIRR